MSNDFNIDQVISVDFEADSELNVQVGSSFQGASIDDTVISPKKTWSSQKISDELDTKADSANVYTKTQTYSKTEVDAAIPSGASEISYDNTSSGLSATNTQAAIDEVNNKIPTIPAHYDAEDIIYDNTDSGLSATDVQAAIDELATTSGGGTAEDTTFDDTNVTFSANNVQSALENIIKKLTQAEYDALTPAEQTNGTIYFIVDGGPPTPTSNAGIIATSVSIRTDSYTEESL